MNKEKLYYPIPFYGSITRYGVRLNQLPAIIQPLVMAEIPVVSHEDTSSSSTIVRTTIPILPFDHNQPTLVDFNASVQLPQNSPPQIIFHGNCSFVLSWSSTISQASLMTLIHAPYKLLPRMVKPFLIPSTHSGFVKII